MYFMTCLTASASMPTNGRGGEAPARVITNATITVVTPTSVTVTTLGANVVAGDILFMGQGNWGVCTGVSGETASVKKWHRMGGGGGAGVGVLPPTSGSLIAYPGGVLRTALASEIIGVAASGETLTFTDVLGTNIVVAANTFEFPLKIWGPWRVTASAAGPTISFRTVGNAEV